MSFLFGGGRPQVSSAEKIQAAEFELETIADLYNRYTDLHILHWYYFAFTDSFLKELHGLALESVFPPSIEKEISIKENRCA